MITNETVPSWSTWLSHAIRYEQSVKGKKTQPSKFNPAIQYNLIALALENYVMAMVSYHHQLPENHTFSDLIRAWEAVAPLAPDLKATILKYEDMQSICSMDNYARHEPTQEDLAQLSAAVFQLGAIVKATCQTKPAS